ncbi:phosphoribosylformylglycinamidine synthase subunit PurS [Haliangium sp. UPWRP_2]|uniref:phosphoribosylformylglycinamidine synthase subunit PurS n=1 Tax=Haliangium sp. UPWRP_2 TaxID=1931276 RepID=UPI001304B309|nr:phosphoribosylformylglycinamidine synthase subunit PurS [Haliangium sp. UPWRP_2]
MSAQSSVHPPVRPRFCFELVVTPRRGAADPQAEAISQALRQSDFAAVHALTAGRYLRLGVTAGNADEARAQIEKVCRELLVNPNLETHTLRLLSAADLDGEAGGGEG